MSSTRYMERLVKLIEGYRRMLPTHMIESKTAPVVLLDPGHGGIVNGKYTTAPNKMNSFDDFVFYEGVFNRALMYLYAANLYTSDSNYVILVSEDEDIPLGERVRRATDAAKRYRDHGLGSYYHSIHANYFRIDSANGVEIFTSKGETKADMIATIHYMELRKLGWNMRPDLSDGDPDKEDAFYVLKETPMPAILTETGFYSNREEALRMIEVDTIERIAELFFNSYAQVSELHIIR